MVIKKLKIIYFLKKKKAWLELSEAYLNELEYAKAAFCLEELILMYPHNHVYYQRYADVCIHLLVSSVFIFELIYRSNNYRFDILRAIMNWLEIIIAMQ